MLTHTRIREHGDSSQLIVLVHAWTMSSNDLEEVIAAIEEVMLDADLLVPDYPSGVFCNADPIRITEALVDAIDDAVDNRKRRPPTPDSESGYKEIILIGHSLGALLVRKAFVFAKGQTQDHSRAINFKKKDWADQISRIILMAGTNRGWTFDKKARDLSKLHWLLYRVGTFIYRWTRIGRLINSVRRGAPFVTNLRIQWLTLIRRQDYLPTTIQLLGDRDDIVTEEDNVDIQSGAQFIYKNVRNTGHVDVIRFSAEADRKLKFLEALTTPKGQLKSDACPPLNPDGTVDLVVFVMHGIRDYGHWTAQFGSRITQLGESKGIKVHAVTSSYGYFPMLGFLLQPERHDNVRWFGDKYTEVLAKYPNAQIAFVGHSNGTYLLASALKQYTAMFFDNVVLAGSVVPRNYSWDSIHQQGRIGRIRNYIASEDWVVAIFPAVFELLTRDADLGSAGHNGFLKDPARTFTIHFAKGGHGAAIVKENFDSIAHFVLGDTVPKEFHAPEVITDTQNGLIVMANKFCWLIWLVLLITVSLACFGSTVAWLLGYWHETIFAVAKWMPWWLPAIAGPPIVYSILRFI